MEVAQKTFSEKDTPAPWWSIAEPGRGLRLHPGFACHLMRVMKGLVWSAIVFPRGADRLAQEPVAVIYLYVGEAAKAKQITQELKSSQDRDNRATPAWANSTRATSRCTRNRPTCNSPNFRVAFSVRYSGVAFH
jgi:hypothetical protein